MMRKIEHRAIEQGPASESRRTTLSVDSRGTVSGSNRRSSAAHFSQLAVSMDPGATHEHSDDAGGAA